MGDTFFNLPLVLAELVVGESKLVPPRSGGLWVGLVRDVRVVQELVVGVVNGKALLSEDGSG